MKIKIFFVSVFAILTLASVCFSSVLTDQLNQNKSYPTYEVNGRKYISLKTMIKALNIQSWGRIEDRIYFDYQGKAIKTCIDSSKILLDDQQYDLDFPVKESAGEILYPLDSMDRILSTIKPLPKKVEPQTEVAPEASQPVSSSVQSNLEKPFVILIDPGHGGKDNGATGNYGLKEKDVNLDISLRLRAILQPS